MSTKSVVLNVEERKEFGTSGSRRSRRGGKIPSVVYGRSSEPKSFLLKENEWTSSSRHGNIHLVELKPENGESLNALVKEVQFDYLSNKTLHIDFVEIKMDELITTSIALHVKGIAVGISQGGVLEQLMHEIEISCLPGNIPESIEVDVTTLELDKAIHVKDLVMPEGVNAITPGNQAVCHVIILRAEAEAAATAEGAAAEAAAAEPEVIATKGKKEEEGEEGAPAAPAKKEKEEKKK